MKKMEKGTVFMKKGRKLVSWICVVTMLASMMTGTGIKNISADAASTIILKGDEERTTLISEAANEQYNFALNKNATASAVTGGNNGGTDLSVVTNGAFPTVRNAATTVTIGQKIAEDKWVQIDLGRAYDTSKIDRIAVQYYSLNTSARAGYQILYSLNGIDFIEVGNAAAYSSAAGNPIVCLDKITLTQEQAEAVPYAKYVRVVAKTDNNNTNNGLQVMGMAVLTDGTTTVDEVEYQEVATLDNPVSLTVTSSDYEQLEYVFEASPNDKGDYIYYAYVDGKQADAAVIPGNTYVVTGLTGGKHTVTIVAFKNGVNSDGIKEEIDVNDTKNLLTSDRNFAVGKKASASSIRENDAETNITDGNLTTLFRTATTDTKSSIVIDLGNNYRLDAIERTVALYAAGRYPKKYTIDFSSNGVDFETVVSEEGTTELQSAIINTKECSLPAVRYVRFSLSEPVGAGYGFQMYELGVIVKEDADLTPVEVATLNNPASLTVTSSDYEQLEYSFEAAEGDEGDYTYYAYVDGTQREDMVVPGVVYQVTGLSSGQHTVRIVSFKKGVASEGITQTVTVSDTKSLLTDDRNIAIGKKAAASSIRDEAVDLETNITDGNTTTLFRTEANEGITEAEIVIDLGQNFRLDAIERTVALYQLGRYPKNYTIDYSINGTDFETVAIAEGTSELQTTELEKVECKLPAVRYIRFSMSNPFAAGFGFQMYELGVIVKEGADLTPVEVATVYDPAAFDVEVTGYNTVNATIIAGDDQDNYRYNVYIDNKLILKEVEAGTYEIKDVPSGNKKFTVKSVVDNITSEGISIVKEIQDSFTYTFETLTNSNVEAGKVLDEEKIEGDSKYYNYSLYKGVKATALSEENAVYTAQKAIDGDSTTRWASVQGVDPQWYVVDLGNTYKIDEIDIVWQTASAKNYDIEFSVDGNTYTKLGMVNSAVTGSRYDNLKLSEETAARYIKITGTARTGMYGYSIWELGVYGPEEIKTIYYNVSIDGVEEKIEEGEMYTLPDDAEYGYFCDGKMYAPNTSVEITEDMVFTSVKELSVSMADGAGIRYLGTAGIRFQASVASDNMDAVASDAITEGTLITANDIYEAKGTPLTLTSDYTKIDVKNSGWFKGEVGTYCGSICDVVESNYIRNFTARAYVTVNYENADAVTVYSDMGPVRSISQVAAAVKAAGYPGIAAESQSIIDSFIK